MTTIDTLAPGIAEGIIEQLRKGIPPRQYASLYSVGEDEFLDGVRRRHLEAASEAGRIRFISGSWGAGKTHFLRLLREKAFAANYLVATVELSRDETPFNKFEEVFYRIIRSITSPEMYEAGDLGRANAFTEVLHRALAGPGDGDITPDRIQQMREALFAEDGIDIDFRRMIARYWQTFLPDAPDPATVADERGQILQWFAGEGTLGSYRSRFGVQKIVNRANARLMLQSLSRFARHIGYRGLVILLDEAEMSYSVMQKSNLKQAHNNLLHLINGIEESEGLLMLYAATPDFYIDDHHGIVRYGALAQRIGRPDDRPPRPLDRVWNLDAVETTKEHYTGAAKRIREIYLRSALAGDGLMSEDDLEETIARLVDEHPEFSQVSTWRVVVTGTVHVLDTTAEGEPLPSSPEELHDDIMARLRAM
jgi:BREX system ATP-binding protein BrxC/D